MSTAGCTWSCTAGENAITPLNLQCGQDRYLPQEFSPMCIDATAMYALLHFMGLVKKEAVFYKPAGFMRKKILQKRVIMASMPLFRVCNLPNFEDSKYFRALAQTQSQEPFLPKHSLLTTLESLHTLHNNGFWMGVGVFNECFGARFCLTFQVFFTGIFPRMD